MTVSLVLVLFNDSTSHLCNRNVPVFSPENDDKHHLKATVKFKVCFRFSPVHLIIL